MYRIGSEVMNNCNISVCVGLRGHDKDEKVKLVETGKVIEYWDKQLGAVKYTWD